MSNYDNRVIYSNITLRTFLDSIARIVRKDTCLARTLRNNKHGQMLLSIKLLIGNQRNR